MLLSLYEALEVSHDASTEEIRKAYHKRAIKFHPDKNKDPEASAQFRKLSFAYSILSDDEKRAEYDEKLKDKNTEQYEQPETFSSADTAPESHWMNIWTKSVAKQVDDLIRAINLFNQFKGLPKEKQLTFLHENKTLLADYIGIKGDEVRIIIDCYPVDELIEVIKGEALPYESLLQKVLGTNPEKMGILFAPLSPIQRWSIMQEVVPAHVLEAVIHWSESKEHKSTIEPILFSFPPAFYFDELTRYIETLSARKEKYAERLAKALRALCDNLAKDFAKQEKQHLASETIQRSTAMFILRNTLMMTRKLRFCPTVRAINIYEEKCKSKQGYFETYIADVVYSSMAIVIGVLIATLLVSNLEVLPMFIFALATASMYMMYLSTSPERLDTAFNKHRLFKTELTIDENNVVQAAYNILR